MSNRIEPTLDHIVQMLQHLTNKQGQLGRYLHNVHQTLDEVKSATINNTSQIRMLING